MKRKVSCVLVLLLVMCTIVASGCTKSKSIADYKNYTNLDTMVTDSDTIVIGQVINTSKNENITIGQKTKTSAQYTVLDIKVIDVMKGEVKKGDILKVKQRENETTQEKAGFLEKEEKYLLFLEDYENTPSSLLNPYQGYIKIKENDFEINKMNNMSQLLSIKTVDELKNMLNNIVDNLDINDK
jgi:hypothetical protein